MPLEPGNRRLVEYWLSLWEGDEPPWRRSFDPSRVRDLLPGLMIEEINPGKWIRVRLSGTAINQAVGVDLTGKDLLELTAPQDRETRRIRNVPVAQGAAALCRREGKTRLGAPAITQEIQLPFRDVTEEGARLVLLHTTWRPTNAEPGIAEVTDTLNLALDYVVIPLWR